MEKKLQPKLRFPEFKGNWENTLMEKLFPKIRNGFVGVATPFYIKDGVKYLQGKNIKNGKIDSRGLINITREFHEKKTNSQLQINDVLMVQSGHVGECARVTEEYENSNCHALLVLTPIQEINSNFFINYFYSPKGKKDIYKIKTGNTIEHILSSDVKKLEIKVPSLPEQEKIASFLNFVESNIEQLELKREKLAEYKKGIMQRIYDGKWEKEDGQLRFIPPSLRFKRDNGEEFPDWEEKRLGEVCKYTKGFAFKSNTYKAEGIRIIRVSDLTGSSIKRNNDKIYIDKKNELLYEKYKIEKGDIIITTVGSKPELIESAVGRGIYINKENEGLLNQNMLKLNNNNSVNNKLIHSLINSPKYISHIKAIKRGNANQANITVKELLQYKINLPCLEEQEKIADFLTDIDRKIGLIDREIEQSREFKRGLLQQMFV